MEGLQKLLNWSITGECGNTSCGLSFTKTSKETVLKKATFKG